jgi:hypothetical protein
VLLDKGRIKRSAIAADIAAKGSVPSGIPPPGGPLLIGSGALSLVGSGALWWVGSRWVWWVENGWIWWVGSECSLRWCVGIAMASSCLFLFHSVKANAN